MRTARTLLRSLPPVPEDASSDDENEDATLVASAHEAYALADELERVLPPSHRGLAHRLRLAAETAGGLYMASQTRRLIARALCASSASGDDAAS